MPWLDPLVLFVAAALAGAVNSVAGGGTLLTFPALLWTGQSEIVANATSTVALWPGQLGSLWGYRGEMRSSRSEVALLAVPSFLGGLIGALLLMVTGNAVFAALVPWLILLATLLFMAQEPLARWQRRRAEKAPAEPPAIPEESASAFAAHRWGVVLGFQLLVAIYGGYFGAGIGILMLAAFGYLGLRNIHHMNALKNINGMAINAVAAAVFIINGKVDWRPALLMAVGSIAGGYLGAGTARRIGQKNVRRIVILIGLVLAATMLARRL